MKQETFNLFDAINREGIGNHIWGLCQDIDNTADYFGTVESIQLQGQFVYVYRSSVRVFPEKGKGWGVFIPIRIIPTLIEKGEHKESNEIERCSFETTWKLL